MSQNEHYKDLADEELLGIIKSDKNAENEFYERYKNKVKYFIRKHRLNSLEREDLIQEGMIGLFNAIETFDTSKGVKFATYASVCIKNRIYNTVNSMWTRKKNEGFLGEDEDVAMEFSPEEDVIIREISEDLKNAILELSKREKKVLELYLDKKSYQEIASSLDISTKKVDNILMKIKSILAEKVGKEELDLKGEYWDDQLKNSIHKGLEDENGH
ncbi:MAG: sigma-70 family RNA polymerase sigma factor [Brevinematales bacterium]|nr:sigma-70 family RNA polymerase sigma factor [Brevinematales bacterium]